MNLKYENHRQHLNDLIEAALLAADPDAAVRENLRREGRHLRVGGRRYELGLGKVFLVAIGKAAMAMGLAAAEVLGDEMSRGILVTKKRNEGTAELTSPALVPENLTMMAGGHPISDEESVGAAEAVTRMLEEASANDLILCLISGGASALFSSPMIPLPAWQHLGRILLESGCTINELNAVRRQLDRVKGGGLARLAAPAACASLILSDVVGNPLEVIGSGPTVLPAASGLEAKDVLLRYKVEESIEPEAWQQIVSAMDGAEADPVLVSQTPHNVVIADVRRAADAAMIRGAQLGFVSRLLTVQLQGEAREVARVAAAIAKDAGPGSCLILAGETTVTVRGKGRGGRNQELALAAALELEEWPGVVIGSFATDGEDGVSDAAGAFVNGQTAGAGRRLGLDPAAYLADNDSTTFFEKLGDGAGDLDDWTAVQSAGGLLKTGHTGTNVNDLLILLTYPDSISETNSATVSAHDRFRPSN